MLWLLQGAVNWLWGFSVRVMDTMDRALGADPAGHPPTFGWTPHSSGRPDSFLDSETSLRRTSAALKVEQDLMALMERSAQVAWKRREAKMDDDRAAMFRRNCLGLAGRMIKRIEINVPEPIKYTDDEQVEAALAFYKYIAGGKKVTSANNAQAARHDAITHSVVTDNRQTATAAVASAKKYLKFLEGAE